jgi:Tol biopolymer transport system component
MIGTKLAHYEITSHLGTGGMGEVYQATDSKLGRSVAIKLLPDAFTHDAARAARFDREARVLASLNHPNIAAIHGVEDSGGRKFLVMELVPGETLAERIRRGPVPVNEALVIANQVLDGLEAAHDKGVIHRDLKPANIKITTEGVVKVLDFGLAKPSEGDASNSTLSNSPTMSMAATNAGVILGTAAYMSPEQAKGRAVDRRSDIFAFGCVLYEMLAGKPAFDGEDVTEILSRILQREPDWTLLPSSVPPGIMQVLRLCLEKDARKRRGTAGDVRIDLMQPLAAPESVPSAPGRSWMPWVAAAVFAVITAGIAWTHFQERAPEMALAQFEILSRMSGGRNYASVSPDGRWLAYYDLGADGRPSLFLRDLASMAARAIPGSGEQTSVGVPIWSTDSRYLAFTGSGVLMKVAVEGGTPQKVVEGLGGFFGAWNGDSVLLRGTTQGILRASVLETQMTLLNAVSGNEGDTGALSPHFLPDGRHYIYGRTSRNPEREGIFVASLDSADNPKRLTTGTTAIAAREPGTGDYYLLVIQDGHLTAHSFDLNRLELTGEPQPLGPGLRVSASDNGVLAIQHVNSNSAVLTWYNRRGDVIRSLPPQLIGDSIDLSPDGSRLAFTDRGDLWLRDLARGTSTRFTTDPAQDTIAIWSPLGDRIVFDSSRSGPASLYLKPSNGAIAEELLLSTDKPIWANDWSRDGRFLLYSESLATAMDLSVLPMDQPKESRTPIPYLRGHFAKKQGQFSQDGQFVAYASNESGRFEIYVQPFPEAAAGKWPISSGGGVEPRWSKDGSELFYFSGKKLMSVSVKTTPSFSAGTPRELFEAPIQSGYTNDGHRWHVAPDGTFLMETFPPEVATNPITVIVNWPELLKKGK